MADRKPSFFRSLISSNPRRRSTTQQTTTRVPSKSDKASQSTTVTSQVSKETGVDDKSNSKFDGMSSPSNSPLSKSNPSSPSRGTGKTKSPPHSSSPRAQTTPSSPSRVGSYRSSPSKVASQSRSSSRSSNEAPSNSSKGVKPKPPSEELTQEPKDEAIGDKQKEVKDKAEVSKLENIEPKNEENGDTHKDAKDNTEVPKPEKVKEVLHEQRNEPDQDTHKKARDKAGVTKSKNIEEILREAHEDTHKEAKNVEEILQEQKDETHEDALKEAKDEIGVPKPEKVLHEQRNQTNGDTHKEAKDEAEVSKPKNVKEVAQEPKIEANEGANNEAHDKVEDPKNDTNHTNEAPLLVSPRLNSTHQRKKKHIIVLPNGDHKNINSDITTLLNKMSISDDRNVSVITLAGDNRGASMRMGSNDEKSIHIHRRYKTKSVANSEEDNNTDGSKLENNNIAIEQQPEACFNNNAQAINNSIVFNSSLSERNPGVHLVFGHVPNEPNKTSPTKIQKSEFNMTQTNKHAYEPRIRRRCLRGLFLEPSDSDTDDPDKPRRHGCRADCNQLNKDNNKDAL